MKIAWLALALIFSFDPTESEFVQTFDIEEGFPVGSVIGTVGSGSNPRLPGPPYLIVPLSGKPDDDLLINQQTGEIRTKLVLDREKTAVYTLSAIPRNGGNIKVTVNVVDVNDNSPHFSESIVTMNIPENIPKNTKRRLLPAIDQDLGIFSTQKYRLLSGNDDNAFSLHYERDRDGILNVDLIVQETLDREKIDSYRLEIVAFDGGVPPRTGTLTVNVNVQDLNDNPPVFSKQRYFTTISEDSPVGSSVLKVTATDSDIDQNAQITYSINRRQSDRDRIFKIDRDTGLIMLDRRLDFDRKQVHEIVVVARDGGQVPQETSAFITVRLMDHHGSSLINTYDEDVLRVVPDPPSVLEDVPVGTAFARLEIGSSAIVNLEISQSEPNSFKLRKNSSGTFLVTTKPLDYETQSLYPVTIDGSDPNSAFHISFDIVIEDVNDNSPLFEKSQYLASLEESVEPGSSVLTVKAFDEDDGDNGRISYSLDYSGTKYSDWFMIQETTGLITTQTFLDCEMESNPSAVVVATDHGYPSRSATATLSVSVSDVNDNQPLFESSFYEAKLPEDQTPGKCFLKVHATDLDCGSNSKINYSLRQGDENFVIEKETGEICLAKELDHEKQNVYDFIVVAMDRGGLSTSTMVKIEVQDVNDNVPTFAPSQYFAKIKRDLTLDTHILTLQAVDADSSGRAAEIEYRFSQSDDIFRLDSTTGIISLSRPPPPGQNRFHLEAEAIDGFNLVSLRKANIEILVVDEQFDHQENLVYEFSVPEDVSPYSEIGKVSREPSMVVYGTNAPGYFSLDSDTGLLRSESRLDHETNPKVVLNVRTAESRYFQILIHIEDVNDNTPDFGPSEIALASVPENFGVGEVVYVAKATDKDKGINGEIRYQLKNGDSSFFKLDSRTGELKLGQSLDYETADRHEIVIEAQDSGLPPLKSALKLTVFVHDVNDNVPQFINVEHDPELVRISENHPIDTHIHTFRARDADRGRNGRISYSISKNDYVTVLPNSGVLVLTKPLDREINDEFQFIVTVKDHGTPPLSSDLKVKLLISDRNDNSPKFERDFYKFVVAENLTPETILGKVTARDNDEGTNGDVFYSFKTPTEQFKIDKLTGTILTSQSLDREEKNAYEILVEAMDGGVPSRSSQTLVEIQVTDVNDNPPILTNPRTNTFYIKQGSKIGTVVGKLQSRDPDENNHVTYSTTDSSVVQIGKDGTVRLVRNIEYSEKKFQIPVTLTDDGSPSRSVTLDLTILVLGKNEKRQYLPMTTQKITVREGVAVGTKIGSMSGSATEGYSFRLLSNHDDDETNPIMIDRRNGDVFTIGELDADTNPFYKFRIRLDNEEDDAASTVVDLEIVVENENDEAPSFKSEDPLVVSIPENAAVGVTVVTVQASDDGDDVNYELIEQSPSSEVFALDSVSGALTLTKPLDYERDKEFLVIVRATDGLSERQRHSTELTILVTVTDINDNAPIFLSSNILKIYSDVALNIPIMKMLAVDYDGGTFGKIYYSILSSGNHGGLFQIDEQTGELSLTKPPDPTTYRLVVRARDGGGLYTENTVTVEVKVNDDSTPRFASSITDIVVSEDIEPDTTVTSLDLKQRISTNDDISVFTLLKGYEAFYVEEYSGRIKTLKKLDRETRNSYSIVVQVSSDTEHGFSDTAVVNVQISDVNDNPPTFGQSCKSIFVPESNLSSGEINNGKNAIHAVIADDADLDDNGKVSYSLLEDFGGKFSIDSETGKLFAAPLDREQQMEYKLEIVATDSGSPARSSKCELKLRVLDVNDNPPIFTRKVYEASVQEDVPVGTEVLKLHAVDADDSESKNSEIKYSIMPGSNGTGFAIDPNSGSVYTTRILDRERISTYLFHVLAMDAGLDTVQSSTAQVRVSILDTNDHDPVFTEFPFRANMSSVPNVGVPLLRLSAVDPDEVTNGQRLRYELKSKDEKRFQLSPNEGILTVSSNVKQGWVPGSVETLEVIVYDEGRPPRSSDGLIEIRIDGGSTSSVTLDFQSSNYEAELDENPSSGQDVAQVRAVRSDGRRQKVIYNFVRGNDHGAFQINSNNGLIRVRDPEKIDYEFNTHFNLTISGRGLGEEGLYAYASIVISIKNINDNAPRFAQDIFYAKASEGYAKGTEVITLIADDLDGPGELVYEIVDGNVDGAFAINPRSSGIVRTNTVLDREIRDEYELTVSAADSGTPSLSGTTKVRIYVIDANDNPPHFPPMRTVVISKDAPLGSLVANLRANDIDISPPSLEYHLNEQRHFVINAFSGQMYLFSRPDFDIEGIEFNVTVMASDSKHEATAVVYIRFEVDPKGCRLQSRFTAPVYEFSVPSNATFPYVAGKITLDGPVGCMNDWSFKIDEDSDQSSFSVTGNGSILVHHGNWKVSHLVIKALSLHSENAVVTTVVLLSQTSQSSLSFIDFPTSIVDESRENANGLGDIIYKVKVNRPSDGLLFKVSPNPYYDIDSTSGTLFRISKIFEPGLTELTVSVRPAGERSPTIEGPLRLNNYQKDGDESNSAAFTSNVTSVSLPEDVEIGRRIPLCTFQRSSSAPIKSISTSYARIVSGNDMNLFSLDEENLALILKKPLDYETATEHGVIVRMDGSRLSLCKVKVVVTDVNDNVPKFPVSTFVGSVRENAPVGTKIMRPKIIDADRNDRFTFWTTDQNFDKFTISRDNGQITTNEIFDYESGTIYSFPVFVNDSAGHVAECSVDVLIESVDEYPPVFEQSTYYFSMSGGLASPGDVIGQVRATDRDSGPDGRVTYTFETSTGFFGIDRTRGVITVIKALDTDVFEGRHERHKRSVRELKLIVRASSLRSNSLKSSSLISIAIEDSLLPEAVQNGGSGSSVPAWLQGVLVGIVLLFIALGIGLFIHCKRKIKKQRASDVHRTNSKFGLVDLEMSSQNSSTNRFPPQYSEIVLDYDGKPSASSATVNTTTSTNSATGTTTAITTARSELSEKSHRSASSGRGSVEDEDEDDEDEEDGEIRMINEGSCYPFIDHDDKLSQSSVQNSKDYFARLGIDIRKPPNMDTKGPQSNTNIHNFDDIYNRIPEEEDDDDDGGVNNHDEEEQSVISGSKAATSLIYTAGSSTTNKHGQGQPSLTGSLSSIVHSEEELAGSYNWDYLLDWGPQYQPLAHVFKEISRLKDSSTNSSTSFAASAPPPPPSMLPRSTRSPISHDSSLSQNALSPNFHPALSPLATKSPSVSPLAMPMARRPLEKTKRRNNITSVI